MSKTGSPRFKAYEKPKVEERFDYAELVRKQIDRCLMTSVDELSYEGAIQALEALIPDELQDEEYMKELSNTKVSESKLEYMYAGPIKLGSAERPIMAKIPGSNTERYPIPYTEDEDGNRIIDWDDFNIVSPVMVEKEYINWNRRFKAAFNQFVRMGIAVRRTTRG